MLFHCDLYDSFLNKVFKITVHGVPCFLFVCLFVLFCFFFKKVKSAKKTAVPGKVDLPGAHGPKLGLQLWWL